MKTVLGFMATIADLWKELVGKVSLKTLIIAAVLVAAVGGITLGFAWRKPAPAVANLGASEWVAATGKTEGLRREFVLRPDITAKIKRVLVKTNDRVQADQLLVELENGIQDAQVRVSEAQLKSRQADYDKAKDSYDRLVRSGIGAGVGDRVQASSALQRANADLEMTRAELKRAQSDLDKTLLRAPWDGYVLEVFEEPGALISPMGQPILRLNDISRRRVRAFVEELDALRVQPGQEVEVTVDGAPGKKFTGKVHEVLMRMDRDAPRSDQPGEYVDIYHRPVVIDLEGGLELPLNVRVQVRIHTGPPPEGR